MPDHAVIPIEPFTGGVNLIDPPGNLDPIELSMCENYRLDPRGYPYKRPGHDSFGSTPTKVNGNNPVNFVHRYYKSGGTKELIGAAGGKIYKLDDLTGIPTQINIDNSSSTLCHTTNLFNKFTYKNRLYMLDGLKPIRYNGTDAPYAGFLIHAAITAVALGAGGGLSAGTYKYMVTGAAGDMGEGPAGAEISVICIANDKVNLSNILDAASRYEESSKRIYRTKANGTSFFFLAEIAIGVTTYADVIADSALGFQYVPVHNPRATARFAVLGPDDRVYYCGMSGNEASLVEASDIGFPDRILDNEYFTVSNNDNDLITGAAKSPSGVVFFKRNSMWLVRYYGSGLINISPKVGTVAPNSIVEIPGGIIFVSTGGEVYFYDGVNLNEIGRRIKPELWGAGLTRIVAAYHDFRYHLSYDYRGSKGYNARTLEYDLVSGKWDGPHSNGDFYTPSYYSVWDSERDSNELLWGEARAAAGSYIYVRRDFVYTDRGQKFNSTIRSGSRVVPGDGEKIISKAFIEGRFSADTNIELSIILDDEITRVTCQPLESVSGSNIPIFGIAIFGTAIFNSITFKVGEDSLGIGARANSPIIEVTDRGSSIDNKIESIRLLGTALPLR